MEMWGEEQDEDKDLNKMVEQEQAENKLDSKKNEMAIASTGLFFLIFLLPVAFGIFGFPFNIYVLFSIAAHEAGHFFSYFLFGSNSIFTVAGGTGLEYAVPVLSMLIFGRSRRGAALAMIFVACLGSIMPNTAHYMESAEIPGGTSVGGAVRGVRGDMNPYSHDWNRMFLELGLLGHEYEIAAQLMKISQALVLVGVIGSVVGFWFLMNYSPASFPELLLVGGIPSALYFGAIAAPFQLAVCGGLIFLSLAWYAFTGIEKKLWGIGRPEEKPREKKEDGGET